MKILQYINIFRHQQYSECDKLPGIITGDSHTVMTSQWDFPQLAMTSLTMMM